MLANRVSVFRSPSNSDAVKITRDSMGIAVRDDGVPVVVFRTALKGDGGGEQQVPADEFPAFIEALESYHNGVERADDAPKSAIDMLHASIATTADDDSVVTFKLSGARGSKSTKIAIADIRGVASMMRGFIPRVEEIVAQISKGSDEG
jgi:hypothetical protein